MLGRTALLLAAALLLGPAPAGACEGEDARPVDVAEVTAGDALVLADGTSVRLAGILAPRALDGEAGAATAEAARAALADLVAAADEVRFAETPEAPDRYGRRAGDLFLVGAAGMSAWGQERLVAAGKALVLGGEGPCRVRLDAAENRAIAAQAGLWSDPAFAVVKAGDHSLAGRIGLVSVVEGRIVSVGQRVYMTFLDFGVDYRRDFTVMLAPKLAGTLEEQGIAPGDLAGREVRVRGIVEESGGPAIRLVNVYDIMLLDETGGSTTGP